MQNKANLKKHKKVKPKIKKKPKMDINALFKKPIKNNKEYHWGQIGREIW